MRRDKNDADWQATKKTVIERDQKDRTHSLPAKYALGVLSKAQKIGQLGLDCAHIYNVGKYPLLCYDPNNIVLINRYLHSCLDDFKSPLTRDSISLEEVMRWWEMLAGKTQWTNLQNELGRLYF